MQIRCNFPDISYISETQKNNFQFLNIYIFIAFALVESVILNVLQFPMHNIYQSCDLGRAFGWSNVNVIQ